MLNKKVLFVVFLFFVSISLVSVSASPVSDFFKKLTGNIIAGDDTSIDESKFISLNDVVVVNRQVSNIVGAFDPDKIDYKSSYLKLVSESNNVVGQFKIVCNKNRNSIEYRFEVGRSYNIYEPCNFNYAYSLTVLSLNINNQESMKYSANVSFINYSSDFDSQYTVNLKLNPETYQKADEEAGYASLDGRKIQLITTSNDNLVNTSTNTSTNTSLESEFSDTSDTSNVNNEDSSQTNDNSDSSIVTNEEVESSSAPIYDKFICRLQHIFNNKAYLSCVLNKLDVSVTTGNVITGFAAGSGSSAGGLFRLPLNLRPLPPNPPQTPPTPPNPPSSNDPPTPPCDDPAPQASSFSKVVSWCGDHSCKYNPNPGNPQEASYFIKFDFCF